MVTWTSKLSKDLRSWHCSFPNCHGTVSDVSKDSSCDFPRCNIDPSKLAVPEVFAPVSIKRFIGGLGAWISGSACFRCFRCFSLLSIVEHHWASGPMRCFFLRRPNSGSKRTGKGFQWAFIFPSTSHLTCATFTLHMSSNCVSLCFYEIHVLVMPILLSMVDPSGQKLRSNKRSAGKLLASRLLWLQNYTGTF